MANSLKNEDAKLWGLTENNKNSSTDSPAACFIKLIKDMELQKLSFHNSLCCVIYSTMSGLNDVFYFSQEFNLKF